jgi:DNA-binding IclR family transcriptional regulator
MDLLELLARSHCDLGVSEIARALGMSKPGTHRLLATLASRGFVERLAGGRYQLGLRVWELGHAVPELDIVNRAAPFMAALTRRSNESAILGVLSGRETVYLHRTDAEHAVRVHTEIGSRLPAHCTSTGLALLAALSDAELDELLPARLEALTEASVTSHDALRRELAATRARGYAVNVGGWRLDVAGVAAAIAATDGRVAGALCIAAPRYRVTRARLRQLGGIVRDTADRIAADLFRSLPRRARSR